MLLSLCLIKGAYESRKLFLNTPPYRESQREPAVMSVISRYGQAVISWNMKAVMDKLSSAVMGKLGSVSLFFLFIFKHGLNVPEKQRNFVLPLLVTFRNMNGQKMCRNLKCPISISTFPDWNFIIVHFIYLGNNFV